MEGLGSLLGPVDGLGPLLEPVRAVMGSSWGVDGRSWAALVASVVLLGPLLTAIGCMTAFGAALGPLLAPLGAALAAFAIVGAALRHSWVGSWRLLGRFGQFLVGSWPRYWDAFGPLFAALGALWPLWGRSSDATKTPTQTVICFRKNNSRRLVKIKGKHLCLILLAALGVLLAARGRPWGALGMLWVHSWALFHGLLLGALGSLFAALGVPFGCS